VRILAIPADSGQGFRFYPYNDSGPLQTLPQAISMGNFLDFGEFDICIIKKVLGN